MNKKSPGIKKIFIPNQEQAGLYLETGYNNSNPNKKELISAEKDGTYKVIQHFEQGADNGYSFHLNVALVNKGNKPVRVPINIRWGEIQFDYCRDYMYIGYNSGEEWRMISTFCYKGITNLEMVVPPGRHFLCCTPKFDYYDYLELLSKYSSGSSFERIKAASTSSGREISCLRAGNKKGRKIIITTRAHPYESSGGYCISALLEQITMLPADYDYLLGKYDLYLFPMINPDGVSAGNCCISTSGLNFGQQLADPAGKDRAAKQLASFILKLKPVFYLDMHNNTGPHLEDTFRTNSEKLVALLTKTAPDNSYQQKVWGIRRMDVTKFRRYLLRECAEKLKTVVGVTEFPWYTRSPEEMKKFGIKFFNALFPLIPKL